MNEDFLHFIWKFQLFEVAQLYCTTGEKVEIIHPGSHNTHAGPDFFNAKIKIAEQLWAGNVELHWKSSDWAKHNHHKDRAYDNVILHIVTCCDTTRQVRADGSLIHCAVIQYDKKLENRYLQMLESTEWVACQNHLKDVDEFVIKQLLGRLLIEKLSVKVDAIREELRRTTSSWEEVFFIFLLKTFGFSINALPFELLAKSLPYQIILKHRNSLHSIESLLYGQAGFLKKQINDEYYRNLKSEYQFLKSKYKLKPLDENIWKFMRTRPQNFPTIRIAQLAGLLFNETNLFSKTAECDSLKDFRQLLTGGKGSKYWLTHYSFGQPSNEKEKTLGDEAVNLLAINLWIPMIFAYGHLNDNVALKEKALDLLDSVSPEDNSTVSRWKLLGMPTRSAFYTQALLHLKKEYCDTKQCLKCSIGKKIVEGGLTSA